MQGQVTSIEDPDNSGFQKFFQFYIVIYMFYVGKLKFLINLADY